MNRIAFGRFSAFAISAWIALSVTPIFAQQTGSGKAIEPTGATNRVIGRDQIEAAPTTELVVSNRDRWNDAPIQAASIPPLNGRVSVLVHFDPAKDHIARPQTKAFSTAQGAYVKYEYDVLPNVINIRNLPEAAIGALERLPGVIKVERDAEYHATLMQSVPLIRGLQTQISGAGFSAAGAGIRVCVVDTGIDSNATMYSSRIDAAAGWDFVNGDSNPEDDHGHGSHVAGTVLGGTNVTVNSCLGVQNAQGVAPQATLIGVKVLNASGSGSTSNIVAGINRCASAALPNGRANVINLSLGSANGFAGTCDGDSIAAACNNAVTAGVVVVAAAGNNNFANAVSSPACGSKVIAVAATWDRNYPYCDIAQSSFTFCTDSACIGTCTDTNPVTDQRVCFSNRSTKIDVAAPGCVIFSNDSTVPAGNGLTGFCGTSQASPHVAGLAALILGLNSTLTPTQVRDIIRNGAIDKGSPGFDTSFGYGRIDVLNSLALVPNCTTPADCDDGDPCTVDTCNAGICAHGTVSTPNAESPFVQKNRYLSIVPGNAGLVAAIRVKLTSSSTCPASVGHFGWVGMPDANGDALLEAAPVYLDWSTLPDPVVHVGDDLILPGSMYSVQMIGQSCNTSDESKYSPELQIPTMTFWGNVVGGDDLPNVTDVSRTVDNFRLVPGAPSTEECDLVPAVPDRTVNIADIAATIDGFKGLTYPYSCP